MHLLGHMNCLTCIFTDIDECTTNTDDCHANASCINTDGNFTCTCNDGYIGDGTSCAGRTV